MSLAGLGAFAGGAARGIEQGSQLTSAKVGREAVKQQTASRVKEAARGDQFAKLMQAIVSGDEAALDMVRTHFGGQAKTVTPGGIGPDMPAQKATPYSGVGLGTL